MLDAVDFVLGSGVARMISTRIDIGFDVVLVLQV
jgi:hypothetical protein